MDRTRTGVSQEFGIVHSDTRRPINTRSGKSVAQKFIKSPKGTIFIILVFLSCTGIFYPGGWHGLRNVFLSVFTGVSLDYLVAWLSGRPMRFSDGALITGMIVGGVFSPAVPWYMVMMTTIAAILSKHILRNKRKPLFNPAAAGLLIAATLFSAGESWWSALSMMPVWTTPLLLAGGFIIADRINKLPLVFSFLGMYTLFFLILGIFNVPGAGDALRPPYIHAALFLSFFMLTDPPTSPAKYSEQILFGFLAALIGGVAYLYFSKLSYLLIGLLAANGLKALMPRQNRYNRGRHVSAGVK